MMYDVVIAGGGPAGLAAALALGRARKRVLVCDAGPRRNAAAERMHNFLSRDGTPPDELRRIAREQLGRYPSVEVEDTGVRSITGERGAFHVDAGTRLVEARRVLLATGMIDERLAIDGFAERWGHSIVQCPYCHGWEARDRPWGYLLLPHTAAHAAMFAVQLRGWTREVTVFSHGAAIDDELRARLDGAGIRIETAAIARLDGDGAGLRAVTLAGGATVPCELLFAHPPQQQVGLVRELGVKLDGDGFVEVDPMRQTSIAGVYAAGDLTTRGQGAILAAAAGTHAAAAINAELTMELALAGALSV
ncbi:MAG TPA: NAD(P)/FAD-dependent oxidoreductase [Kofleriaceae bacterium]|nr:NAD(P)/FAD-dependent oxidoreductase [Kofleriaceae bacterium]